MRTITAKTDIRRSNSDIVFEVLLAVALMAFIPPEGFSVMEHSRITIVWKYCMIVVLALLLLAFICGSFGKRGLKVDSVALLVLSIVVLLGLYTALEGGNLYYYGQKVAYIAGPWLIVSVMATKNPRLFIKTIKKVLLIACLLNLITMFVYLPHGSFRPEIGDYWLFGQRTYMRNILFPALFFALADDCLYGNGTSKVTLFLIISNPIVLFLSNAVTSLIICLFLEIAVIFYLITRRRVAVLKQLITCQIVIDVVIVHLRSISFLHDFVVNSLHRDITFSGRTQVWDTSIKALMENPLSGTGIRTLEDSGLTLTSSKQLSNVHNQFLDLTFKGGILTALAWVALVARCCYPLFKRKSSWFSIYLGLFIGAFLLEGIMGDIFYPEFYLLLYMAAYIHLWEGATYERRT